MLEKVLEEEYKQIDKEYKIKKEVVNYLGNLVRENYSELVHAFEDNIWTNDVHNKESLLYHKTKNLLDELEKEATNLLGVTVYYNYDKPVSPDIKFGMTQYEKFYPDAESYGKRLTEKGREIINNYRRARELPSIEETNAKNSELRNKFLFKGK